MKSKFWVALTIYIYTVAVPTAWALQDSTSFNPETVQIQAANIGVPIGTVIVWTKEEVPDGWLECNGQAVNAELYLDLAMLMKNTPNYQGMFLRGAGSQTINHGKYGSVIHRTTLDEVQNDTIRNATAELDGIFSYSNTSYKGFVKRTSNRYGRHSVANYADSHYQSYFFDMSLVVPTSDENRPVNVGVKYIIKAE